MSEIAKDVTSLQRVIKETYRRHTRMAVTLKQSAVYLSGHFQMSNDRKSTN